MGSHGTYLLSAMCINLKLSSSLSMSKLTMQDLGVSDAQAIFAAGGGGGDGERDEMGRERSEKSTARGAERTGERAEAGGDTSSCTH